MIVVQGFFFLWGGPRRTEKKNARRETKTTRWDPDLGPAFCRSLMPYQGERGYGVNLQTKWKLIPSRREGIRRKSADKMEADSLKERGDTA